MKAILQREKHPLVTPGNLLLPWSAPIKIRTLELPWIENEPDKSCIPAGIYIMAPYFSPKHQIWVWQAKDVPGRTNIEMHPANFACDCTVDGQQKHSELEGCIAPGYDFNPDIPMLLNSKNAFRYLQITIGRSTTWQLEIKDAIS